MALSGRIVQARAAQLRSAGTALRAVWPLLVRTDRPLTLVLGVAQAAQAVIPLAELWIAKLVIDRLVSALRTPHPSHAAVAILWLVALALILALLRIVAGEVGTYSRQVLAERVTIYCSEQLLARVQLLDLETLERPNVRTHLQRLQEGLFYRPAALVFRLVSGLQGSVTLITSAVLLLYLFPICLPLLVVAALPYAAVQSSAAVDSFTLSMGQTRPTRTAQYLASILSGPAEAKEVRILGLGGHLTHRYRQLLAAHQATIASLARRRGLRSALAALVPAVAYAGVFALLAARALDRQITVGDLTLYIGLVLRSQDALQQLATDLAGVVENSLFLDDYNSFLRITPTRLQPLRGWAAAPPVRRDVSFDGVSYRYPGAEEDALHEVSLQLPAGRTIALVGENGAGKTTLVKLLTGLYEPRSGTISADGIDLRSVDADAWRRQIAVIFQDFIHYALTVRENIGFGQVDQLQDRERIAQAAERGGAGGLIARLPAAYDTMLGRVMDEGAQLSGGEWQRIALARAFIRDAPVLVLDEPTSALDARAEFETFRVLRELTRDRAVLLISHRFSTVRLADYIYVLERGRIVEAGSHEELLRFGGRYAELFELQAAGYQ